MHGHQEGAAYNGHFGCVCYHPLFLFNQFGDCEAAKLRSGNVHSADGWRECIDHIIHRYLGESVRLLLRPDAALANPELYLYLEVRISGYAIWLRSNPVLLQAIARLLLRPTLWPVEGPVVYYYDFIYQAQR